VLTDSASDTSARRRHPVVAVVTFVAAISVLVGGVVFAFVASSGTDGETDPTSAVQALLDAATRNDAIGVLEALPPDEREAFRDTLPDIVSELQRLGVLTPMSLSDVPGVHVELQGVRLQTEQLFSEVGRVVMTDGQLVVTPQPGFPLPDRTRALLEDDFHANVDPSTGAHTIDLSTIRPTFVAVNDSGGWHASLLYTLAEAIRGDGSGPLPRFNGGPVGTGSATPEDAVRDLFTAAVNLDANRAVTLANPAEDRALYDYASLFLPEAQRRAQAIETDEPFAMSIKQLDLDVDGTGSMREVRVRDAHAVISDGDQQVDESYAGGCLTTTQQTVGDEGSVPSSTTRCDGHLDPAPATAPADPTRLDRITGWQQLGRAFPTFVVQERNGRWFISPVRTVLTTVDEGLHQLQPSDVATLSDRLAWAWDLYGLPGAPDTRQ
jgi:hypothetical protein